VNFRGTFVYLICVLDGYSRTILSWDIRTSMDSYDVTIVLWHACEKYLVANNPNNPRLITDNGSQFLTAEFKATLKEFSMTNVKTSVNHPQSNGKLERFHGTIKSEAIRDMPKFTLEQMKKEVEEWIRFYNYERLHSSLDSTFITLILIPAFYMANLDGYFFGKRVLAFVKQKRNAGKMSLPEEEKISPKQESISVSEKKEEPISMSADKDDKPVKKAKKKKEEGL
jgi:hypothetical protein